MKRSKQPPRGHCVGCGRQYALKPDGTVWPHGVQLPYKDTDGKWKYTNPCPGIGKPPAPDDF